MTYCFTISNVKSSVKLRPPVDFDFVTQRCRELGASCKRFRNLLSIDYKKTSFVLFKSSKRSPNSGQHLNITGCRNTDKTVQAIEDFNYLIERPFGSVNYRIDSYTCTAQIGYRIDLEAFYMSNSNLRVVYNRENFPGLWLWSPKNPSLCATIYHTKKINVVGGKDLEEIEDFFKWIKDITIIN